MAQTLVKLGVDVSNMTTRSTLSDGLKMAFKRIGYSVEKETMK